jgi:carbonic anhydrase
VLRVTSGFRTFIGVMKKLIKGIMEFRRTRREPVRELFAQLALGQKPDCLFIACSDSRVAANVFASTDPGDLFVVRNLGNIMPPFPDGGSAVAALEFAVTSLEVSHIVVCGHSDCGAMRELARTSQPVKTPLSNWLRHAEAAAEGGFQDQDALSRRNVALQLENLRSHAIVRNGEASGKLRLHGIWFHIRDAEVYYLEEPPQGFVLIDDVEGERILTRLDE